MQPSPLVKYTYEFFDVGPATTMAKVFEAISAFACLLCNFDSLRANIETVGTFRLLILRTFSNFTCYQPASPGRAFRDTACFNIPFLCFTLCFTLFLQRDLFSLDFDELTP